MDLLIVILVLLLISRAFGEIAYRLGQPSLVGELIAGIAIGVNIAHFEHLFPSLAGLKHNDSFLTLSELGIFFLMLYGGVELRASDFAKSSKRSFIIAVCGLILPLSVGYGLATFFIPESPYKIAQCLFVGTALAITAVPASIRVLMDLGKLHSKAGKIIVSAAVIDDILSLIVLALLTGFINEGGFPTVESFLLLAFNVITFFVIAISIDKWLVPHVGKFIKSLRSSEFEFSSLILAALAFGVLAHTLGLHYILGAFMAGLFFERRIAGQEVYDEVKKRVRAVTMGLLAPIFFLSIGLSLDLSAFWEVPGFLALLIIVAFLTKLIGSGVPAYCMGMSRRDSIAIGTGMSARGAVELIIADIALRAHLFEQPDSPIIANMFSSVVIVAVLTTVVTPIMLKRIFAQTDH